MRPEMLGEEHLMFRDAFRKFVQKELVPHMEEWEQEGIVSREAWLHAGASGFLGMDVPEAYGGIGEVDFRYSAIVCEELAYQGVSSIALPRQTDMVIPYITKYGNEDQKRRWLPKLVRGELIGAIAMTEPNTGSDIASIETIALRQGDQYLLNGQKTFISNGLLNDLVIVVAKTDPQKDAHGISLFVVERGMQGYERGRNLEKIGLHAQDTAELFFRDVQVPRDHLLGEEDQGFIYLMEGLPRERMTMAIGGIASAETALEGTIEYCKQRTAFGRPIGSFQNSRFKLAEMKTEVEIGRVFVDHCIMLYNQGGLSVERAAMAKWWITDMQNRVIDQCLQLHGGYGYMKEYSIAKAFVDARAQKIYGGTSEIMKEIIGRSLGF